LLSFLLVQEAAIFEVTKKHNMKYTNLSREELELETERLAARELELRAIVVKMEQLKAERQTINAQLKKLRIDYTEIFHLQN
jgi:hypothetical protein